MFENQRNPYYSRRKERGKFLAGPPVRDFGKTYNALFMAAQGKKIILDKNDADFIQYLQTAYGLDAVIASYHINQSRFYLSMAVRFDRIYNDLNRILCGEIAVYSNCTYISSYNVPVIGQIADDLAKACCTKYGVRDSYDNVVVDIYDARRRFLTGGLLYSVYMIVEELEKKYGLDETVIKISSFAYSMASPTRQTIDVLIETPEVWDRVLNMKDEFEDTCFSVIHSLDGIGFIVKDDIEFKYVKAYALSPEERENAVKNYERYWGFRDRW